MTLNTMRTATATDVNLNASLVDERMDRLFVSAIVDREFESLGLIHSVWLEEKSGDIEFVGVQPHWLSKKVHVLPAADMEFDESNLRARVPFSRADIEGAPRYGSHVQLSHGDRDQITQHFSAEADVSRRAS